MLNKSIANKKKSKRKLLCISLGFFVVAFSLAIIIYNNNYQIIRDEQYFIDGRYESLKYGSTAKEFFTQFIELDNNSDIKFLYKNLGKRISSHKYYTFYMVEIPYTAEEYQNEKIHLSKDLEDTDPKYCMLNNYLVKRVIINKELYTNNFACICFDDSSSTIRYIIFCCLKVNENSISKIRSIISWHIGKEWDIPYKEISK